MAYTSRRTLTTEDARAWRCTARAVQCAIGGRAFERSRSEWDPTSRRGTRRRPPWTILPRRRGLQRVRDSIYHVRILREETVDVIARELRKLQTLAPSIDAVIVIDAMIATSSAGVTWG